MQQVEPAVALDVEDQVEFARVLVGQQVAALDAGGVQQDVDAPAALADIRRSRFATASASVRLTL